MQFNKNATERAKEDVKKAMTALNDQLLHHTYLVGERVTLADIVVACTMIRINRNVLDPEFRKPFGNVNRWFTTIVNQPQVKKVVGAVVLAEKMAQFDAAKFAELQKASGGGDSGKKDKKKADKPKQEPTPKKMILACRPCQKKKTHSQLCPRVIGTWTTSRGSTPTTMKISLSLTFGKSSTRETFPFGVVITSTMMNWLWFLCLAT